MFIWFAIYSRKLYFYTLYLVNKFNYIKLEQACAYEPLPLIWIIIYFHIKLFINMSLCSLHLLAGHN